MDKAVWWGSLTCILLYSAILITALNYTGEQNESYSIFNHFISELGSYQISALAIVYNSGLILAAIGFLFFINAVFVYLNTNLSKIAFRIGALASFICIFVGLVSEDHRLPHLIIALVFFSLLALAILLFSLSIFFEKSNKFSIIVAFSGLLVPILFVVFLCQPIDLMHEKRIMKSAFDRPDIWLLPFFEWMMFIFFTIWILVLSIDIHRISNQKKLK